MTAGTRRALPYPRQGALRSDGAAAWRHRRSPLRRRLCSRSRQTSGTGRVARPRPPSPCGAWVPASNASDSAPGFCSSLPAGRLAPFEFHGKPDPSHDVPHHRGRPVPGILIVASGLLLSRVSLEERGSGQRAAGRAIPDAGMTCRWCRPPARTYCRRSFWGQIGSTSRSSTPGPLAHRWPTAAADRTQWHRMAGQM